MFSAPGDDHEGEQAPCIRRVFAKVHTHGTLAQTRPFPESRQVARRIRVSFRWPGETRDERTYSLSCLADFEEPEGVVDAPVAGVKAIARWA